MGDKNSNEWKEEEASSGKSGHFMCSIALNPPEEKPSELPTEAKKAVYNEFLVRYLENIGVEPTRANIEYVKKQTPLDGCKMTAAYKSRGALNDIIYITPKNRRQAMSNNVRKIGVSSAFSQAVASKTCDRKHENAAKTSSAGTHGAADESMAWSTAKSSSAIADAKGNRDLKKQTKDLISFREFRIRFGQAFSSLQFELSKPPELKQFQEVSDDKAVRLPPIVTKKPQDDDDDDDDDDELKRTDRKTQEQEAMTTEEWIAGEDATRKLQLTMEDVLAIQTMFARSFPLHPELNRVSEEDIVLGIAEITSLPFAALIRTICVFLHRTVMMHFHPKALNDASTKEEHEALMLAMYEGYTQLQAKLSTKTRTLFLYPLLLLSMRVTVETVFRNAYPAWFSGPVGNFLMATLNFVITSVFDPDHYSAASTFLHAYETSIPLHQKRCSTVTQRKALTNRFYTTSALVQSVLHNPASANTRVFMRSGKPLRDKILPASVGDQDMHSQEAKKMLFNVVLQKVRTTSRNNPLGGGFVRKGTSLFDTK